MEFRFCGLYNFPVVDAYCRTVCLSPTCRYAGDDGKEKRFIGQRWDKINGRWIDVYE